MSYFGITTGESPAAALADEDLQKFKTCKHRSAEVENTVIEACCSSRTITGYTCTLLDILNVQAETCKNCQRYQAKDSP